MKLLLLFSAIFILCINCNAQTKIEGDTLFILDLNAIKVIKIGDNIYKIESPTISKVEELQTIKIATSGIWTLPNSGTLQFYNQKNILHPDTMQLLKPSLSNAKQLPMPYPFMYL